MGSEPDEEEATIATNTDWEQLNKEWKSSKQSQELFCELREISYSTFVYHRCKLLAKRKAKKKKSHKFSSVKITTADRPKICMPIILHLRNGTRLEISPSAAVSQLKPLLVLLGAVPC